MKSLTLKIVAAMVLVAFTSCNNKAKEADTKAAEETAVAKATAVNYKANLDKSSINWKGFKPTGSHNGTIAISSGMVAVNEGVVESGSFEIDMKSISVLDIPMDDKGNADLKGHLTSADFFDVEKFPMAKFEITGVKNVEGKTVLSGNLTMKEATNNISFPVTTETKGNMVMLTSETFTIDRSKWNIKYGSKSFFDNLGDKFINDDIELKVVLVAEKS